MEPSNVNNLNGVPNFGHGFPEKETGQGSTLDGSEVLGVPPEETKEEVTPEEEGGKVEITREKKVKSK